MTQGMVVVTVVNSSLDYTMCKKLAVEVKRSVAFLTCDKAGFISGEDIAINVGQHIS